MQGPSKTEDVGRLVVAAVVAAKPLDHAERVGRAREHLGEHQVIQTHSRVPRGLHAEVARLGTGVARAREHGRRRHVRRAGAWHERGPESLWCGSRFRTRRTFDADPNGRPLPVPAPLQG